jgi:hypothetical protein
MKRRCFEVGFILARWHLKWDKENEWHAAIMHKSNLGGSGDAELFVGLVVYRLMVKFGSQSSPQGVEQVRY